MLQGSVKKENVSASCRRADNRTFEGLSTRFQGNQNCKVRACDRATHGCMHTSNTQFCSCDFIRSLQKKKAICKSRKFQALPQSHFMSTNRGVRSRSHKFTLTPWCGWNSNS